MRIGGEATHAIRVLCWLYHVLRNREQTLVDQALGRDAELARETKQRLVADRDPALSVGERNSVDSAVDQAAHQRRVVFELTLARLLYGDVDNETLAVRISAIWH